MQHCRMQCNETERVGYYTQHAACIAIQLYGYLRLNSLVQEHWSRFVSHHIVALELEPANNVPSSQRWYTRGWVETAAFRLAAIGSGLPPV